MHWKPAIANNKSLDEDLNNNFNESNKNAKRSDSIKRSSFADNLNNTKSSQTHCKEDDDDTYSGNDVQDDGNANNDRVGIKRISSHKIVSKTKSLIFIRTDNNVSNPKFMISSKCSCMKCRRDSFV